MRTIGKALSWIIVAVLLLSLSQPVLAVAWPDCPEVEAEDDVSYATQTLTPVEVSNYERTLDPNIGENLDDEYPDEIFSWPMSYTGEQIDYSLVLIGSWDDSSEDDIIVTDFGSLAHYEPTTGSRYIRHIFGEDDTYWDIDYCPFCPWPCQCSFNQDSEVVLKNVDGDATNELLFLRTGLNTGSEDYYCNEYGTDERITQAFYIDYHGNDYDTHIIQTPVLEIEELFGFDEYQVATINAPYTIIEDSVTITAEGGYPTYTENSDYTLIYMDDILYVYACSEPGCACDYCDGDMDLDDNFSVTYDCNYMAITDVSTGNIDGDSNCDFLLATDTNIAFAEASGDEMEVQYNITDDDDDENDVVGNFILVSSRNAQFIEKVIYAVQYNETDEYYSLVAYIYSAGDWEEIELDTFAECPVDIYPVELFDDYTLLVKYGDLALMYVGDVGGFDDYAIYEGAFNTRMSTYDYDEDGQNDLIGVFDGAIAIYLASNTTVAFNRLLLSVPTCEEWYEEECSDWEEYYVAATVDDNGKIYALGTGSSFLTMFDPLFSSESMCVNLMGYMYDAVTGDPINSSNITYPQDITNGKVNITQYLAGATQQWLLLTDDAGFYSTTWDIYDEICTYINYSREADYNTYPFEVWFNDCGLYQINASLIPLNFTYNGSAIVGTVNGYPWNAFLDSNVTIDNGTWNSSTTTNAWGFYIFDNLSEGCYWINVNSDGYFWQNLSACVNGTNYTIQNFLLSPDYYNVSIAAYDAISGMPLNNWTIHIEDYPIDCVPEYDYDYSTVVTNWTLNLTLPYGGYTYSASLSGYYEESGGFFLVNDTNVSIYFYPIGAGIGTYYPPRAVEFRVQTTWGVPIPDVYVTCQIVNTTLPSYSWLYKVLGWPYDSAEEMVGTEMHDYTDTNGQIDFIMVETLKYKMTFTKADPEVNETIYIYPKDEHYKIIVGTHWLEEESVWDDVNYSINISNANETHAQIDFTYTDGGNDTSELFYWINLTVLTNSTNLYNITHTGYASCESITENFVVARGEAYNIGFIAQHDDAGEIRHSIFVRIHEATHRLLELEGFPDWIYNLMAIGMLVGIAAIFNRITIRTGAVVVPLCGWGLWFVGWLGWQNSMMPGILAIAATLGVILYIAIGAREKMLT